ncbi:hypothetical protein P2318_21695 [Myxococcaceae bacterium GXIMD 01537]
MRGWHTRFESDALVLKGYRFPRRGRSARIPREAIHEVCTGWFPPTLRTREGEYLFVPAAEAVELADFADRHGIPFVHRVDVWSFILEEFLDTEPSPEASEGALRVLEENGIRREETTALRALVERRMLTLTAFTWEWIHYGLFDVLQAMTPWTFTTGTSFRRFYEEAMRVADRGGTRPASREEFLRAYTPSL